MYIILQNIFLKTFESIELLSVKKDILIIILFIFEWHIVIY